DRHLRLRVAANRALDRLPVVVRVGAHSLRNDQKPPRRDVTRETQNVVVSTTNSGRPWNVCRVRDPARSSSRSRTIARMSWTPFQGMPMQIAVLAAAFSACTNG